MTFSIYGIHLSFPAPTGPYSVGYTEFELINELQLEPFNFLKKSKRRLMIHIWYPSDISQSQSAHKLHNYLPKVICNLNISSHAIHKIQAFLLKKLTALHTHAYDNSPIAIPKVEWNPSRLYPILIFSHGAGGISFSNTALFEELASHGYVCFSLAHPYDSGFVIYPDGSCIIPLDRKLEMQQKIQEMQQSTTVQEMEEICLKYSKERNPLELWQHDTLCVLEKISAGLPPQIQDILDKKMDLNQIGLFGHSLGGIIALHMAFQDPRIKAGINIDGGSPDPELDFLKKSLEIPFMFFRSYSIGPNDYYYMNSRAPSYLVTIKGAYHMDFTDMTIFPKFLKNKIGLGSIAGERMLFLVNKYIVGFFDRHLKNIRNENTALLSTIPSPFPEVSFKSERT
jgi:hypothetical protein